MAYDQNSAQGGVEELFLEIIRQFEIPISPASGEQEFQDVIVFEVIHHGTRYSLVRSVPGPNSSQLSLSPREREIVRLIAKGMANKKIAILLEVSQWTVATHLRRVFMKLGVNTRAEMIARVLEAGLLDEAFLPNDHPGE